MFLIFTCLPTYGDNILPPSFYNRMTVFYILISDSMPQDPFPQISFSFTLQNMVHVFLLSAEIAHPCFQIPSYPLQSPLLPPSDTVWWLRCRLDDRRMKVRCSDNSRDICLLPSAETGSDIQVIGEFLPLWQSAWCTNSEFNTRRCTYTFAYILMAWCLIKHRDSLTQHCVQFEFVLVVKLGLCVGVAGR